MNLMLRIPLTPTLSRFAGEGATVKGSYESQP